MRGQASRPIPGIQQLDAYSVNRDGEYEGVRQTLYDFQTYPSAGSTELVFFQVPQGQGGKTLEDTNMETAGTLPSPKRFLVQSISLHFYPGEVPVTVENSAVSPDAVAPNFTNDVYTLEKQGYLDFFIGSKSYLQEAPLGRFPPKTCLKSEFATSNAIATATTEDSAQINMDYSVFSGRPYFIDPNVLLMPTQNFNVKLRWGTAQALPSGNNARIGVVLDGILYRLSQ